MIAAPNCAPRLNRRAAAAAIVATVALAFGLAAAVKRAAPAFAAAPIAVIRDGAGHSLWAIRLAPRAHEVAVDAVAAPSPPAGEGYQLWLTEKGEAHSLGLLPTAGRAVVPEIPALTVRLAGGGELLVSLEPARGSIRPGPSGPIAFRAPFGVSR